jgi:hypothetical protein
LKHSIVYDLLLAYAVWSVLITILGTAFIAKLYFFPKPKTDRATIRLIPLGPDGTGIRSERYP